MGPENNKSTDGMPEGAKSGEWRAESGGNAGEGAPALAQPPTERIGAEVNDLIGYDRQIETLKAAAEAIKLETKEEREKRERRERSKKTIAAFSDGAAALANLFFATEYAPSSYNSQSSMAGKVHASIEQAKAEREADAERYLNYMLRLGDAQNARAKTLREMQAQTEAQKLARERAANDAQRLAWEAALQDDKRREQKGKGDKAESEATIAGIKAQYAPDMAEAELTTEKKKGKSYEASATNSLAHAAAAKDKDIYGTFDGKPYYNKRDYDKAVWEAAKEYNARHPKTEKRTRKVKDKDGRYVDEEYLATVDPVPLTWQKETAYGQEPQTFDATTVAASLEPLLRKERETAKSTKKPSPTGGKGKSGKKSPTA